VLAALAGGEAMTAAQVAEKAGLVRGSVSTTLSKLAKAGEVQKADRGYRLAPAGEPPEVSPSAPTGPSAGKASTAPTEPAVGEASHAPDDKPTEAAAGEPIQAAAADQPTETMADQPAGAASDQSAEATPPAPAAPAE
jgi:hypothetical protein